MRPAGEARLPGIAKQSATTKPELAESSSGAGPSWSRAKGNSAAAAAAVKSAGEARFARFVKYSLTSKSEPELAESYDEEFSPREFGEWLVSEVRRHGRLDEFFQEMGIRGCAFLK